MIIVYYIIKIKKWLNLNINKNKVTYQSRECENKY